MGRQRKLKRRTNIGRHYLLHEMIYLENISLIAGFALKAQAYMLDGGRPHHLNGMRRRRAETCKGSFY